jgi:hypothetical protein
MRGQKEIDISISEFEFLSHLVETCKMGFEIATRGLESCTNTATDANTIAPNTTD